MGSPGAAGAEAFVSASDDVMPESLVVTMAEARRLLRRSASTIYRMINAGLIRRIPCPVRPMILRQSLMDYVMNGGKAPKKPPARTRRSRRK